MIPILFVQPYVGFTVRHLHRTYTLAAVTPYTRKTDGAESTILEWTGECAECAAPLRFTTGGTKGNFQIWCLPCMRERNAVKADARAVEREVVNVPQPMLIWRALDGLETRALGLAVNLHRRKFAPLVLRDNEKLLSQYTLGEVAAGIVGALECKVISEANVARRPNRHAVRGYQRRPLDFIRRYRLVPEAEIVAALYPNAPQPTATESGVFA